MKTNSIALSVVMIAAGVLLATGAFAAPGTIQVQSDDSLVQQEGTVGINLHANADDSTNVKLPADVQVKTNASANASADENRQGQDNTGSSVTSNDQQGEDGKNNDNNNSMSDIHQSAVAASVQSLLQVADREGGIGAQVKAVAQAQTDSDQVTTDALIKIENRSSLKTFFIGTDYKNIGTLRSQMVVTANQIDQLKKLADQATSAADKATLQAQIQVLEQEQVKIDAFIKLNESKFSLFGWLVGGKNK